MSSIDPFLFSLAQCSALSAFSPFSYLIGPRLGQSGLRDVTLAALLVHFTNAGILRQITIFVTIPVFSFCSTSQTRPCALRMSRYVASITFTLFWTNLKNTGERFFQRQNEWIYDFPREQRERKTTTSNHWTRFTHSISSDNNCQLKCTPESSLSHRLMSAYGTKDI